ncbi:hypothetical protein D3C71_1316840 [compost metagenome]
MVCGVAIYALIVIAGKQCIGELAIELAQRSFGNIPFGRLVVLGDIPHMAHEDDVVALAVIDQPLCHFAEEVLDPVVRGVVLRIGENGDRIGIRAGHAHAEVIGHAFACGVRRDHADIGMAEFGKVKRQLVIGKHRVDDLVFAVLHGESQVLAGEVLRQIDRHIRRVGRNHHVLDRGGFRHCRRIDGSRLADSQNAGVRGRREFERGAFSGDRSRADCGSSRTFRETDFKSTYLLCRLLHRVRQDA